MIYRKEVLVFCFLSVFTSCVAVSQENPNEMFTQLFDKYKNLDFKTVPIESNLDDGISMFIFDIHKKVSTDIFCLLELFATLGQTQYFIYKKSDENIWYFHKKAYFYESPYTLENAEIQNTYFKYENELSYVFNERSEMYDIQVDTDRFSAIVDIRSLVDIIEIVKTNEVPVGK